MISPGLAEEIGLDEMEQLIIDCACDAAQLYTLKESEPLISVYIQEEMINPGTEYSTHLMGASKTNIYQQWLQSATADALHLQSLAGQSLIPGTSRYNDYANIIQIQKEIFS